MPPRFNSSMTRVMSYAVFQTEIHLGQLELLGLRAAESIWIIHWIVPICSLECKCRKNNGHSARSRRIKDRTRFYRDDGFASDVRIVWNNRKSVSIWSSRSLDKTLCDRDGDPYVRDECMETRLNRPHLLTKIVTETIFTSETIIWKPGFKSVVGSCRCCLKMDDLYLCTKRGESRGLCIHVECVGSYKLFF